VTIVALVVAGVVAVALIAAGAFAARRALRRLQLRIAAARERIFELQARVQPPGPRRDADLLRHRLRTEMRSTREMLEAAPGGLIFRADATVVLQELATTAAAVEGELAAITRFADPKQQESALATLRPQAEQLIATTYTARQTVLQTAAEDRARRIAGLQADVARQAAALDVYRNGDRELRL
jgi:hypothetical protein